MKKDLKQYSLFELYELLKVVDRDTDAENAAAIREEIMNRSGDEKFKKGKKNKKPKEVAAENAGFHFARNSFKIMKEGWEFSWREFTVFLMVAPIFMIAGGIAGFLIGLFLGAYGYEMDSIQFIASITGSIVGILFSIPMNGIALRWYLDKRIHLLVESIQTGIEIKS